MVEKEVKYAGFHQRLLAHNIDLLPILGLLYGVSFLVPKVGLDWLVFLIVYLGYHTCFELSSWRATPGKKWAKIRVAGDKDDQIVTKLLIRNIARLLSLILFFGGYIMIIFNARRKGLHDYLAGTVVLFDED